MRRLQLRFMILVLKYLRMHSTLQRDSEDLIDDVEHELSRNDAQEYLDGL